ncbi:TetR/AcrR family transcriptional regulator [Phytoactinopolyspora alkaliphila]|uniref:TetR/AcrR family transcriptional regulator n=1 Tax=Phytoactinopolyspora alkaliphila TaxID=1783498 RepID=A0A6N9YIL2_9ACTN|nr:TetR/AcrR family transcriptional regulator [Phytoactinopolyspora alkaliphila]NED94804.1 TetR/AcrR family transcriptional regulator [Phytoactinopolyspora alkaliphila]
MPQTTAERPRRNEKSRQAILTAALQLAGEVGYTKLSIEAIAARAGVGKQTIYRWWPSKAAVLFDAVLALSTNDAGETTLPDTGDLEADLRTVLHATVRELNDPGYDRSMRSLTVALLEDEGLAAEYRRNLAQRMHEVKKDRLRSAQLAGHVAEDVDLDAAVEMIFGPLMNRWLTRSGPITPEYADTILTTALNGLRPRG